jgi:hypothetical protein
VVAVAYASVGQRWSGAHLNHAAMLMLGKDAIILHTSYRSLEIWRERPKAGADEFQTCGQPSHRSEVSDFLEHCSADRPVIALCLQSMDCLSDRNKPRL